MGFIAASRPPGYLGIDPTEPELRKSEFVDKYVDRANRIILTNPIFQAFWKYRALPSICAFDKPFHSVPPQIAEES